MNKAVFLDRDGIVNLERGVHTWRIEDFQFVDGLFNGLTYLSNKGYLLIIITNQSGIAKGLYTHADTDILHRYMLKELSDHGINITEIYYCPHHEDYSRCLCRKPGSLLIEKAISRFDVDTEKSVMIGDALRDIEAGKAAGLRSIKLEPNANLFQALKMNKI